MTTLHPEAPALQVAQWLNAGAEAGPTLEALRGRIVVLHAFQMLCPACVSHALPQARKMHQLFAARDVAVIGLHTVFEHHEVMTPAALEAFVREYRYAFPIGIDRPVAGSSIPATMRAYQLQGTPSTVLIDRQGRIRLSHFGLLDDMALGAAIGQLAAERSESPLIAQAGDEGGAPAEDGCDAQQGCSVGNGNGNAKGG